MGGVGRRCYSSFGGESGGSTRRRGGWRVVISEDEERRLCLCGALQFNVAAAAAPTDAKAAAAKTGRKRHSKE